MDLTEEQIQRILTTYKNKKIREQQYYHNVSKHKEEFKIKNRERAKDHYHNKGYNVKRKEKYEMDKKTNQSKGLYYYYKKKDKIEVFKEKHKEKYEILIEKGIIKD